MIGERFGGSEVLLIGGDPIGSDFGLGRIEGQGAITDTGAEEVFESVLYAGIPGPLFIGLRPEVVGVG